jgi:hypothetical protein
MKELSLILSALSLTVSLGLAVGAYITYKKTETVLNNPEKYINQVVDKVVEEQVSKIVEKLPIPNLNIKEFKLPF